MKLYVTHISGDRMSFSTALIRSLLFCAPAMIKAVFADTTIGNFSLLIYLVWFIPILFKNRQGIYEILSKTVVLQRQVTPQQFTPVSTPSSVPPQPAQTTNPSELPTRSTQVPPTSGLPQQSEKS